MVKVIRLQNPAPKAMLTDSGEAPLASAPSATTTTAMATKMKASGNQRSAQSVKPIAALAMAPSPSGACAVMEPSSTGFPQYYFDIDTCAKLSPAPLSAPFLRQTATNAAI